MQAAPRCPVCGGKTAVLYRVEQRYDPAGSGFVNFMLRHVLRADSATMSFRFCRGCCFTYLEPRFTGEELSRLYCEQYDENRRSYEHTWKVYTAQEKANLSRARIERPLMVYGIVSSYADVKGIGRVLDFGGDDGNNISAFTAADRFVVDPSCSTPVAGVTKIEDVDRTQPYDLIVCAHVLEHLVDPADTLRFLAGSLSDNGLIYVEVPYEVVLFLRGKPGINEHINVFSLVSMQNLARSKGLAIVHAEVREYLYGAWTAKALCCLFRKGGLGNGGVQGLGALLREIAAAAVAEKGVAALGEIVLKGMWRQVRMRL